MTLRLDMTSGANSGSNPISTRRSRPSWWRNPIARCAASGPRSRKACCPPRQKRQRRGDEILRGDHRTLYRAPRHHRRYRQANQRPERGDGSRGDGTRQHIHVVAVGRFRGGVSRHRRRHFRRGIRRDSSHRGNDRCDEGSCRRRPQCFGAGAQPRRRSGRHGARGPGFQGKRAARSVDGIWSRRA